MKQNYKIQNSNFYFSFNLIKLNNQNYNIPIIFHKFAKNKILIK